jgi:hypothetical protein
MGPRRGPGTNHLMDICVEVLRVGWPYQFMSVRVAKGKTAGQIAPILHITERTVNEYSQKGAAVCGVLSLRHFGLARWYSLFLGGWWPRNPARRIKASAARCCSTCPGRRCGC